MKVEGGLVAPSVGRRGGDMQEAWGTVDAESSKQKRGLSARKTRVGKGRLQRNRYVFMILRSKAGYPIFNVS